MISFESTSLEPLVAASRSTSKRTYNRWSGRHSMLCLKGGLGDGQLGWKNVGPGCRFFKVKGSEPEMKTVIIGSDACHQLFF